MKRILTIAILFSLMITLLSGCAQDASKPKVYEDPFHQAKDGEAISMGGTVGTFYAADNLEPDASAMNFRDYDFETVFEPEDNYYLIQIMKVREIEYTHAYELRDGETKQLPMRFPIIQGQVIEVFHDTLGLEKNDTIMLYGDWVQALAMENPYLQAAREGELYYSQVYEFHADPNTMPPYYTALDELADYYMNFFCHGCSHLRSDGMVEYYYEMMPGDLLPEEKDHGPVWAELPQTEFEEKFRELIGKYSHGQAPRTGNS